MMDIIENLKMQGLATSDEGVESLCEYAIAEITRLREQLAASQAECIALQNKLREATVQSVPFEIKVTTATYILADVGVRYWEDATVNGAEDVDGTLIPGRDGDRWRVVIELSTGEVAGWPRGTHAEIHYKVCDDGEYWLLDASHNKIAYQEGYVPSDFLCHGDKGYGDYIILTIGADGKIEDYTRPSINPDEWLPLPTAPEDETK